MGEKRHKNVIRTFCIHEREEKGPNCKVEYHLNLCVAVASLVYYVQITGQVIKRKKRKGTVELQ
jgi:hypothetical protein